MANTALQQSLFIVTQQPQLRQPIQPPPSLQTLSNQQLTDSTRRLALEERRLTTEVIAHLEEIERRRLYLELGYPSLFEWCTSELKYSAAAAQRRIDAMRLSREIPEIREAVIEGRLNLSSVAQAQKFFRHEKKTQGKTYSADEKRDLLSQLENTSSRECERVLASISPEFTQVDRVRAISDHQSQVTFTASQKLLSDLERIKQLWAHQTPLFTTNELLEKMAELVLSKIDPMRKTISTSASEPTNEVNLTSIAAPQKPQAATQAHRAVAKGFTPSRQIPESIRRQVWQRDRGRCTYLHAASGKTCGSTFMLEIDHIQPYALGGTHDPHNLRLACRAHNQLYAVYIFGQAKISHHISARKA